MDLISNKFKLCIKYTCYDQIVDNTKKFSILNWKFGANFYFY